MPDYGRAALSKLNEKAYHYKTVADMKASNSLKEGDTCTTLSYRTSGDYGGAKYIVQNAGFAVADEMSVIQLNNGKLAVFIPDNNGIYPEQFGAYSYYNGSATPVDSTPHFQAVIDYIISQNLVNIPVRLRTFYYVHELTVANRHNVFFKGDQVLLTKLIYNGSGGVDSHIIKYTDQTTSNAFYAGGFDNVSLLGSNQLNNDPIAEYGILFKKKDGNTNTVAGIDWGYKLNSVRFQYFLKDGLNATQSWALNFTLDKVRVDCCNEYGINVNVNEGAWMHISDFTCDYVARSNSNFLSTIATINGATSKCGIGFLNVNTDGHCILKVENARIEGITWLRNHPSDSNLYSSIYINSSSEGMGSIELSGFTGGYDTTRSKNVYWVKMLGRDIGVNLHNTQGMFYQQTPIGYARFNNSNTFDLGTRIGQAGASLSYMPPATNNGNRGTSINGLGLSVETKTPDTINSYSFYRKFDVILKTKPNIYKDFDDLSTDSLGWVCTYPNSGFGVNKLINQSTISVTQGDVSIDYTNITSCFGYGSLPIPYLNMTITYSDNSTQNVNIGNIDYVNKKFYLMGTDGSSSTTISKTDAAAKINVTVAKFKPVGRIKEVKTGTSTFNGDGAITSKTIVHGCSSTPTYYHVSAASVDAGNAGIKYYTADATNITVYFNTSPITGTNNIKLLWKAEV